MSNKDCLTCKEGEKGEIKSTENVVPKWMIESNNPSLIPKQLLCNPLYNPDERPVKEWSPSVPKITNRRVEKKIDTKYTNNWILYWATSEKEGEGVKGAAEAYGKYENSGLLKTDPNGWATFILNCPQGYKAGGEVWEPHIHYVILKNNNKKYYWDPNVKEIDSEKCIPVKTIKKSELKEIIEKGTHILINALDNKDKNIEGSINIPISNIKEDKKGISEPNKKVILSEIKKMKKGNGLLKNIKDIYDIPLIV